MDLQDMHGASSDQHVRVAAQPTHRHHLAAISNAVVMADASTVTQFTNELAFKLSIGLPF